ncbi:MAG: molybdopterin-dependent oxidoreductase [Planctomycetia bacterium]|nr:molybdopterin-dependent oxidoreductase [Planctomycetia bacterium]
MSDTPLLRISGEVDRPARFSLAEVAAVDARYQIADVSRLDAKRRGQAVTLEGLLAKVGVRPAAAWLTLHSSTDDFHASIPLADVRASAMVIYQLDGAPLPASVGGPVRFFIPDHAACHSAEIDECANVKFVDHIELSTTRGRDNRPEDEKSHADLHRRQSGTPG